MQVNVKELTGVSHLKLVFMNVLVLQSFLAVSLLSVTIFSSVTSLFQVQVLLPFSSYSSIQTVSLPSSKCINS